MDTTQKLEQEQLKLKKELINIKMEIKETECTEQNRQYQKLVH